MQQECIAQDVPNSEQLIYMGYEFDDVISNEDEETNTDSEETDGDVLDEEKEEEDGDESTEE